MTAAEVKAAEAEKLLAGIRAALDAQDMKAVVAMLHLLAVRDPHAAQQILDAIDGRITIQVRPEHMRWNE